MVGGFFFIKPEPKIEGDLPPIPKITYDGKELPIVLGSYLWKENVDVVVDYDDLINNHKPLVIAPSSSILIDFGDYKPKPDRMSYGIVNQRKFGWFGLTISFLIDHNTIDIRDTFSNGITIIELTALWDSSGEHAKYYIPIEVK